jgi:hypothetical protein
MVSGSSSYDFLCKNDLPIATLKTQNVYSTPSTIYLGSSIIVPNENLLGLIFEIFKRPLTLVRVSSYSKFCLVTISIVSI